MEKTTQTTSDKELLKSFSNNAVSFTMAPVRGGSFFMGARDGDKYSYSEEKPPHLVRLSDFYIGQTLVTQDLWQMVMGSNPSNWKGGHRPVEQVSWNDCQRFIKRLSDMFHEKFRLPTEAEWEYAARGGQLSRDFRYAGSNQLDDVAWHFNNSTAATHEVCMKFANELGLYDMSGNVSEWCSDWYSTAYYMISPEENPKGPDTGSFHVIRGGSFSDRATTCRVASRSFLWPTGKLGTVGLRLAMDM